jgi:hypothetical protein
MNKKLRTYLGLVVIGWLTSVALAACSSDHDDDDTSYAIELADGQSSTLILKKEVYTGSIAFTAPAAWTAQCTDEAGQAMTAGDEWMWLRTDKGSAGLNEVEFIVDANQTGAARTGHVVLTAGNASQTIQITQPAQDEDNASSTKFVMWNTTYYQIDGTQKTLVEATTQTLHNVLPGMIRKYRYYDAERKNKRDYCRITLYSDNYLEENFEGKAAKLTTTVNHTLGNYYEESTKEGGSYSIEYDANGHVSQLKPSGSDVTYTYSWDGNDLQQITASDGVYITFSYSTVDANYGGFNMNWVLPRFTFLDQCTGDPKRVLAIMNKFGKSTTHLFSRIVLTDGQTTAACAITLKNGSNLDKGFTLNYEAREKRKVTASYSEEFIPNS